MWCSEILQICLFVQIMPLALLAGSDEDSEVAALWAEVWTEGSASEAAALRLYMPEILPLILEGLRLHTQLAGPRVYHDSSSLQLMSLASRYQGKDLQSLIYADENPFA